MTAVGGTAGPPTGHMVIWRALARSKAWRHDPANPLIKTGSAGEKWWSRGHATLFEGPGGKWWMIYHGYENGYWNPGDDGASGAVEWTPDGWSAAWRRSFETDPQAGRPARRAAWNGPLAMISRGTASGLHGLLRSVAGRDGAGRRADGALHVKAKGTGPGDARRITCIAGDMPTGSRRTSRSIRRGGRSSSFYSPGLSGLGSAPRFRDAPLRPATAAPGRRARRCEAEAHQRQEHPDHAFKRRRRAQLAEI